MTRTSNVRPIDPERLRRMFGQPVDYPEQRYLPALSPEELARVMGERVDLYAVLAERSGDALRARAGQPPARAVLRRLGYAVPIAIAAFCVVYFGLQLLRGVL